MLYLGQEVIVEWVSVAWVQDFVNSLDIAWAAEDKHWTNDFIFAVKVRVNHHRAWVKALRSHEGSDSYDDGIHINDLPVFELVFYLKFLNLVEWVVRIVANNVVILVVNKFTTFVLVPSFWTWGKLKVLFTCCKPGAPCWWELEEEFDVLNKLKFFSVDKTEPDSFEFSLNSVVTFSLDQDERSHSGVIMSITGFLLDDKESLWRPRLEFGILKMLALSLRLAVFSDQEDSLV